MSDNDRKLLTTLDWETHPPYLHPAYKSTVKRAPQRPLLRLPQTLSELTATGLRL